VGRLIQADAVPFEVVNLLQPFEPPVVLSPRQWVDPKLWFLQFRVRNAVKRVFLPALIPFFNCSALFMTQAGFAVAVGPAPQSSLCVRVRCFLVL